MAEVAIVKPDHLGDFILSVPAIRALQHRLGSVALFAAPANRFLADRFAPGADFRPTPMRYLQRDGRGITPDELVERLRPFRVVVFLREDGVMQDVLRQLPGLPFIERGSFDLHDTSTQRNNVTRAIGAYSRLAHFPEIPRAWPNTIRTVGLCISAGFHANKWPLTQWEALGRTLIREHGVAIRVIGGPRERDELGYLARRLQLDARQVIEGSRDVEAFIDHVRECDVVLGTDSGTLHLVATIVPVLGLFTSSPWKRFAPFGPANRLLTANVACSPCMQYSSAHYNACLTRECAMLVEPDSVANALFHPAHDGPQIATGHLQLVFDPARSQDDPAGRSDSLRHDH